MEKLNTVVIEYCILLMKVSFLTDFATLKNCKNVMKCLKLDDSLLFIIHSNNKYNKYKLGKWGSILFGTALSNNVFSRYFVLRRVIVICCVTSFGSLVFNVNTVYWDHCAAMWC